MPAVASSIVALTWIVCDLFSPVAGSVIVTSGLVLSTVIFTYTVSFILDNVSFARTYHDQLPSERVFVSTST